MLTIGLSRGGKKFVPCYEIRVRENRSKRDGKFLESIGYYQSEKSYKDIPHIKINLGSYLYWIAQGAQPTKTVYSLYHSYIGSLGVGKVVEELLSDKSFVEKTPKFFIDKLLKYQQDGTEFH